MQKNRLKAFSDGVIAIGVAFVNRWLADALYLLVAAMWFIPDRRIERALTRHGE